MQVHSRLQRAASVLQGRTGQEQVTLHASEGWQEIESSKRCWGGEEGGWRGRQEGRRGTAKSYREKGRERKKGERDRGNQEDGNVRWVLRIVIICGFQEFGWCGWSSAKWFTGTALWFFEQDLLRLCIAVCVKREPTGQVQVRVCYDFGSECFHRR